MEAVDFLHLSLIFRVLLVLFLLQVARTLYLKQNEYWKAPLVMAGVYVCWIWVNIPLIFRLDLNFEYQVMHAFFMWTANILRLAVVFYIPLSPEGKAFWKLGDDRFKWVLGVVYVMVVLLFVSGQGFAFDITSPTVANFYQYIDLGSSALSMLVYSWFIGKSFAYLWPDVENRRFFLSLLFVANGLTLFLMGSAFMRGDFFISSWIKLASYSVFFLWLVVHVFYFQGLGLFFQTDTVSSAVVQRANKLEVQTTTGLHLVWKQGTYKIGIKVLKTDGSSSWYWVEKNKLNKTLGHWLAFALAAKWQENLTHGDMNVIKFRMLETWNKSSDQILQQKHLYEGQRGAYSLIIDPFQVQVEVSRELLSNSLTKEALLDFDHVWISLETFKKEGLGKSKVRVDEEKWMEVLCRPILK